MAKIYSPNSKYNGETATVMFKDGVGETDNKYLIGYLKSKGYKVEETKGKEVDEELETLKQEAKKLEIRFNPNIGKEKLLEKIEEVKKLQLPKINEETETSKETQTENTNSQEIDDPENMDPFEDEPKGDE